MSLKKIRMTGFLFTLIGFAIFSACEKETNEITDEPVITNQENHNLAAIDGLPTIEEYGILHNGTMDYIGNLESFMEFSNEEIAAYVVEFMSLEVADFSMTVEEIRAFKGDADQRTLLQLTEELEFSSTTENFVADFQENLLDILQLPDYEIEIITEDFLNFEVSVLESELSDEEKGFLLGMSTIARYSCEYWHEAGENEMHNWHEVVQGDNERALDAQLPEEVIEIIGDRVEGPAFAVFISPRTYYDINAFVRDYISLVNLGWPPGESTAWNASVHAAYYSANMIWDNRLIEY